MELHLDPAQRCELSRILTGYGGIETPIQRIHFLDASTLAYHAPETATRISVDGSTADFVETLLTETERRGLLTMTRQPALVLVLGYLRTQLRVPSAEETWLDQLLAPYSPVAPLFQDPQLGTDVQIMTNICYSPVRYGLFDRHDFDVGTLEIQHGVIQFAGNHTARFTLHPITRVRHIRMGRSVQNNWVEVQYGNGDTLNHAYFAESSPSGVGEWIGGSHTLFLALRRLTG